MPNAWSADLDYLLGDVVTHGGHVYEWSSADPDVDVEPPGGSWVQVDAAAPIGASGPLVASILLNVASDNFGAPQNVPLAGTDIFGSAYAGPLTLPASADTGIGSVQVEAPAFSAGTLDVAYIEVAVSNADGTEKLCLALSTPAPLTTGESVQFENLDAWAVIEQVGTDLSVRATGTKNKIVSAAGGQFFASLLVTFTATDLAA